MTVIVNHVTGKLIWAAKGHGKSVPRGFFENLTAEIKGSRYALLKNPESLTGNQEPTAETIAISNPKLYGAYLLKENLRLLLKPAEAAAEELRSWIAWARRRRIPRFVELQRKIGRHAEAIMATVTNGLSNARVEAINNKIKLTIRMGYGFRNIDNLIALVMLRCSNVRLPLPGRA